MKDYDSNVAKVLDILAKYRYSEIEINVHEKWYSSFQTVLNVGETPVFSLETANDWCKSFVPSSSRETAILAFERLNDVYQHGHILGCHLSFPFQPTEYYTKMVDKYIAAIKGKRTKDALNRIRFSCIHFCCYTQYNGVNQVESVDYSLLEQYVCFLKESIQDNNLGPNERRVSSFLMYLAQKGHCCLGLSFFMSFASTGKIITMKDLSDQTRQVIEERKEESRLFPPNEFYAVVPDFVERMKREKYSSTVINNALHYFKSFYLFIDMESLGYDRILAETWVNDVAPRFFGAASGLISCRRIFDMFEDYVTEGDILPEHRRPRTTTDYELLPDWYKTRLDDFIEDKVKEGRAKGTIRVYKDSGARFYRFLDSKGVDSFEKITPELIKQFCEEDKHKTIIGKVGILSRVKTFLIHLEFRHVIQEGLHYAIPTCSSSADKKIIQVCSDEERQKIEEFCKKAHTPTEVRDAAILRIGLTTGIRPIDLISLKREDIDFQKGCVRFIQQKTGISHVASLDVAARNAIFLYLRDVRPRDLPHSYLFVSTVAPYSPLSITAGMNALRHAGIQTGGFRKLRKTYATNRLASGATIDDTAQGLGHTTTKNVHLYVSLDAKRMRLCPLSMEETGLTLDARRYSDG